MKRGHNKKAAIVFLQVVFLPLLFVGIGAAILIWGLGLEPSGRLTRGILYGCLFLACCAVGRWKFSLEGIGITRQNVGRGFLYAGIILAIGFAFMFAVQPPEALAEMSFALLLPVLFYLVVAMAEEAWFRGLIFKALYDWRGALLAVFGSAILFGLMHIPTHGWQGLLFSLSIGLPYAIVRLKTDNILGLIVVHWLTNLSDSFVRLSTTSLEMPWLVLLHILVFSGVSILILVLNKRRSLKHIPKRITTTIALALVGLAIILVVPTNYEGPILLCINEQHAIRLVDAVGLAVAIPSWLYLNVLILRLWTKGRKAGNTGATDKE